MESRIKVGIIGGAGYTGGEMIRLLINHPAAQLIFVHSKSNAGKGLHTIHQDLVGETDMNFADKTSDEIDVLFLCVGHGDSKTYMEENKIPSHIKIISLSQDFRLKENSSIGDRKFIYGLPELNREAMKTAQNIANPGCFATAIQLGLLPLAKNNLLHDVYTTGITGSTGAGQTLSSTSHFSWRENNIQAYKTLTHQHLHEINESLNTLSNTTDADVHFVPWRGDFTRGIFITSQLKCKEDINDIYKWYNNFYSDHPFVKVSKEPIFLKQVVNTNNCFIHLEKEENNLVIHSVIDNLVKGASGQAIQNMNLMFGIEETTGLKLKANYF
ncbi:MAG: N-acetyl-gamma-glutamyl-phosphate reductase [Bacteroidota bacterium]|nr:N-acetyl-gamma-glutamyl-phosphate reductase [Bacteroidota bacterium]